MRVRRLASIAVVASLGLSALAACGRSDPSVAAYVGSTRISTDEVDAVYEDARVRLTAAVEDFRANQPPDPAASPTSSPGAVEMPITRNDVLLILVGQEVLRRLAESKGVKAADVPLDELEQNIQIPKESRYARAYATFQGYFQALAEKLPPKDLTDADLRDVFARVQRGGGMPELGNTYAEFARNLDDQSRQALSRALSVRDLIYEQVEKVDAVVNPKFAPAELPLINGQNPDGQPIPLVVIPFSVEGAAAPVVDDDPPVASTPPAAGN
jgi:hypothetical protein